MSLDGGLELRITDGRMRWTLPPDARVEVWRGPTLVGTLSGGALCALVELQLVTAAMASRITGDKPVQLSRFGTARCRSFDLHGGRDPLGLDRVLRMHGLTREDVAQMSDGELTRLKYLGPKRLAALRVPTAGRRR